MDVTQMYISEFVGTAVLLAFGNSTNASILLKKTIVGIYGTNWLHIIFGWAFAVTFGVYIGITLGGPGHLNPAVTFALAVAGIFPWEQVIPMAIAQTAGAFVGATIAAVFYYPHFKETGPDEGNCVGIFATGPAIDHKPCNLMSEIIATFMLILATLCLGKMVDGLAPVVIGILIASIGMSFGATTGYALNPARDFGSRLAYTILPIPNKGTANWQYAWVPFIGPLIGAGLAVVFFKLVAP